ncbi:hypothetical protein F7725_008437 [Dissostichus mawsoni]|uniref:Uncharacterized protein n=1 Tax=Dissostichus mawsoni TaxID=36200 RepID=A0A7J5Y768_DISMA|nr:hypothetical protein F7725_008437 [Dissostichus mawsoni]
MSPLHSVLPHDGAMTQRKRSLDIPGWLEASLRSSRGSPFCVDLRPSNPREALYLSSTPQDVNLPPLNHNLIVPCTGHITTLKSTDEGDTGDHDCFLRVQILVKDENHTEETDKRKKNVQKETIKDMQLKKYCAFGCPVYTVYNIQSSCVGTKGLNMHFGHTAAELQEDILS